MSGAFSLAYDLGVMHMDGMRKSSYSDNGGECVEVGQAAGGTVLIRDTKAREHGHLPVTAKDWRAFTVALNVRASGPDEPVQLP